MCGIAGLLNLSIAPLEDPAVVNRMADQLTHRGPDDSGFYADGPVAFGFRRLSIIDVSGGHQPVANEDKTVWCMLNGEIYNFRELRSTLEQQGHRFTTNSDTETIVHAYEQYGLDFLTHLKGMFAIALWDCSRRRLVLARDRIGKKPLYYSISGDQLAFASELKALLQWPRLDREIDTAALQDYLRFLYVPAPRSIFKAVRKLLPGTMLVADCAKGDWQLKRYWSFKMDANTHAPESEMVGGLREKLEEAVRIRLRSDVPLGAFLSGGVDSSTVVALMSREELSGRPLTFSMAFQEGAFDESDYARLVASHLGTNHHEELVDPISAETLEKIAWHLDEPFGDSSSVPTFLVCKAARRHVTVALSGDGGDEVFAGYDRYRFFQWIARLDAFPVEARRWLKGLLQRSGARVSSVAPGVADRLRQSVKAIEASLLPPAERPFFLNQYFEPGTLKSVLSPELQSRMNGHSLEKEWNQAFSVESVAEGLDLFLYLDLMLGLPDDMLTKVDRMSMANSLEVRCPLLDHDVVEYAGRIPGTMKLNGRRRKYILKRAIADLLPAQTLERSKMGFGAPIGVWMTTKFRDLMEDCLSFQSASRRGWMVPSEVVAVRDGLLRAGARDGAQSLSQHQRWHRAWALLMLELWARRYLPGS